LATQLLRLTGDPKYADEIERLTYNVLMAAMNEEGSWGVRRLGLSEPHLVSPLHCFLEYHQCCVANVPRGLLQLPQVTFMTGTADNSIVMNFYCESEAEVQLVTGQTVQLQIHTDYPESGEIGIALKLDAPESFPLKLRIPSWSEQTTVAVNGKPVNDIIPGSYLTLLENWRVENNIRINFDMTPRIINFPGKSSHIALMSGPIVLARSELLGDTQLDEPIHIAVSDQQVPALERVDAPDGIWMKFEWQTPDNGTLVFCDYASTGKRFEKPDDPYAVKEMLNNRTKHDLRVWMPLAQSPEN
jgi:hypothetical protein